MTYEVTLYMSPDLLSVGPDDSPVSPARIKINDLIAIKRLSPIMTIATQRGKKPAWGPEVPQIGNRMDWEPRNKPKIKRHRLLRKSFLLDIFKNPQKASVFRISNLHWRNYAHRGSSGKTVTGHSSFCQIDYNQEGKRKNVNHRLGWIGIVSSCRWKTPKYWHVAKNQIFWSFLLMESCMGNYSLGHIF